MTDSAPEATVDTPDPAGPTPNEPPANPTDAQVEQGAEPTTPTDPPVDGSETPVDGSDEAGLLPTGAVRPTEEQEAQAREDNAWIAENPNEVHAREAVPEMGGESFTYLENVDKPDEVVDAEPVEPEETRWFKYLDNVQA